MLPAPWEQRHSISTTCPHMAARLCSFQSCWVDAWLPPRQWLTRSIRGESKAITSVVPVVPSKEAKNHRSLTSDDAKNRGSSRADAKAGILPHRCLSVPKAHSQLAGLLGDDPAEALSSSPLSPALERRRQQHPQLQWPRLAINCSLYRGTGCSAGCSETPRHSSGNAVADWDEQHTAKPGGHFRQQAIPISHGSVFYSDAAPPVLWPPWQRPEVGTLRLSGGREDFAGPAGKLNSPMLTRPRICQRAAPGTLPGWPLPSLRSVGAEVNEDFLVSRGDRWSRRHAPVSRLMERRVQMERGKWGADTETSGLATGGGMKVLEFVDWGLDDNYLCSLLEASSSELALIERINMSNNRISARSLETLAKSCPQGLPKLQVLLLAGNRLGSYSKNALASLLRTAKPPLQELDLNGNSLGDDAIVGLCAALSEKCSDLVTLRLAANELGNSPAAGRALGALVSEFLELRTLDLHWNRLQGKGANALFKGIHSNWVSGGQLRRLDCSWNLLGLRCKSLPSEPQERHSCCCNFCGATTRSIKLLSNIFQDSKALFHADLSFNRIDFKDCSILAESLNTNHSLFGLHMLGNEATMDDHGFMIPFQTDPAEGLPFGDEEAQNYLNTYMNSKSQNVLNGKLPQIETDSSRHWGTLLQRNAQCCWVCDGWIDQRICYQPPAESDPSEVTSVYAFFGTDNFSRATQLHLKKEAILATSRTARLSDVHSDRRRISPTAATGALSESQVLRWVGRRMLPPSTHPIDIVFQVNGNLVVVQDMPFKLLVAPKTVTLHLSVGKHSTQSHGETVPVREGFAGGDKARHKDASGQTVHASEAVQTVCSVNLLTPSTTLLDGPIEWLGVLEHKDFLFRGGAAVLPRTVERVSGTVESSWTFESSSFAGFKRDDEKTQLCFDKDWGHTRLNRLIQGNAAEALKKLLRPRYRQIQTAYDMAVFQSCRPHCMKGRAPGLPVDSFTELLMQMHSPDGKLWGNLKQSEAETFYIVSSFVGHEHGKNNDTKGLPERGLARFQFLEAIIRMSLWRFLASGDENDECSAVLRFLELSKLGQEEVDLRVRVHTAVFQETCCTKLREHSKGTSAIFQGFSQRHAHAGRIGKGLTFQSWLELMTCAKVGITSKDLGTAFAIGRQTHVDEFTNLRHTELSSPEFMVALCAAVCLSASGNRLEGDLFNNLGEFLNCVIRAGRTHLSHSAAGGISRPSIAEPFVAPVQELVMRLFNDADKDEDGLLDLEEFQACFNQPSVLSELKVLGIQLHNTALLFKKADADGSGQVDLDELINIFTKVKLQLAGSEHVVALLHQVFQENDADGSGLLDHDEFRAMWEDAGTASRLHSLGVSSADLQDMHEQMLWEGCEEITVDEMVDAFLKLSDPSLAPDRGIKYLRRMFKQADADGSGSLSRSELYFSFCTEVVSRKLSTLGLSEPDWLAVFDGFDSESTDALTLEDLSAGAGAFWRSMLVAQMVA